MFDREIFKAVPRPIGAENKTEMSYQKLDISKRPLDVRDYNESGAAEKPESEAREKVIEQGKGGFVRKERALHRDVARRLDVTLGLKCPRPKS